MRSRTARLARSITIWIFVQYNRIPGMLMHSGNFVCCYKKNELFRINNPSLTVVAKVIDTPHFGNSLGDLGVFITEAIKDFCALPVGENRNIG